MSNAVVTFNPRESYQAIESEIKRREDNIVATLAPGIDRDRWMHIALQAITRSPKLLECTPGSFVLALRDAAELGLNPSGLLGSAYLVPYRNRKTNRLEAQLIPGYRGLIGLARNSGEVRTIEAQVVRQRDDFDFAYGTNKFLHHRPYMNRTGERGEPWVDDRGETQPGRLLDAGPYIAAYAIAILSTGEAQFQVMDATQVEAIRKRSKAADQGPWVTDTAEMWRKSPTRNLLKYLPLSVERLQRALVLEDEAEGDAFASPQVAASAPRRALAESLGVPTGDNEPDLPAEADVAADADDVDSEDGEFEDVSDQPDPGPGSCSVTDEKLGACVLAEGHKTNHRNAEGETWREGEKA